MEEVKLSLFTDDMNLYIENSERYHKEKKKKNLLELINKFSKDAAFKINV